MQEKMLIIKRSGKKEQFNPNKIKNAIKAAFNSVGYTVDDDVYNELVNSVKVWNEMTIEDIQDQVIETLRNFDYSEIADCYQTYRLEHKQARFIRERLDYMDNYANSGDNASTASETDANANVTMKNVANLEGEVYKVTNRRIQRQRMKDKLNELFPEEDDLGKQYIKDLENWVIYTHDEASSPVLKPYCMAATLFPLMAEGVGVIDGVTPSPPNDIQSFSGQVTNLVFLLSASAKGAIALGDYFIALNYYVIAEYGPKWYDKLDVNTTSDHCLRPMTIKRAIRKGMKQFIYGVNQPAGNRSYNSPFSNCSYYDKTYFESIFDNFYYPDGTQPEWKAIDTLQRIFMELHRELRLIKPLTFPVTTFAMVHDGNDVIDKEYKDLCAEEWAKGGSFFCYLSNNPSALASCCRVLNEMSENTFSSTTGMTGIMTGSCNVITLNINRIVQDWCKSIGGIPRVGNQHDSLKFFLMNILERVYKYHIAYKTMLYDLEEKGMFSPSNGGYIYMKKLYSTIGLIGYTEAAQYLGMKISNNEDYIDFLRLIFGTVKEQNKIHSIRDKKRPILFNSEAIPGEGLGVKLYEHDKKDGYWVPEDQNLYNCYFYNPWDNTSILFTFNIPISECKKCGHVVNAPVEKCPKCGSENIDYWTRIIGYLRPVSAFSNPRKIEQKKRVYGVNNNEEGGVWFG